RRAAMVLDLFLVLAQLVRELVQDLVGGGQHVLVPLPRHQLVLVLQGHQELDQARLVRQVHRHLDHHNPVEQVEQFVRLLPDEPLRLVTEVPVAGRDLDLHVGTPSVRCHSRWVDASPSLSFRITNFAAPDIALSPGEPRAVRPRVAVPGASRPSARQRTLASGAARVTIAPRSPDVAVPAKPPRSNAMPTQKQTTVFLENKPGRLAQILSELARRKINIVALSV